MALVRSIVKLTHIVTVFSVARSQKNFCSIGRILEDLHVFLKCFKLWIKGFASEEIPVLKQNRSQCSSVALPRVFDAVETFTVSWLITQSITETGFQKNRFVTMAEVKPLFKISDIGAVVSPLDVHQFIFCLRPGINDTTCFYKINGSLFC